MASNKLIKLIAQLRDERVVLNQYSWDDNTEIYYTSSRHLQSLLSLTSVATHVNIEKWQGLTTWRIDAKRRWSEVWFTYR